MIVHGFQTKCFMPKKSQSIDSYIEWCGLYGRLFRYEYMQNYPLAKIIH